MVPLGHIEDPRKGGCPSSMERNENFATLGAGLGKFKNRLGKGEHPLQHLLEYHREFHLALAT